MKRLGVRHLKASASQMLESGLYLPLVEKLAERPRLADEEAAALIGAYAFLGRLDEAFGLWKLKEPVLSDESRIRCRFFLGVAATRTYRFEEGRAFFDANLKARLPKDAVPAHAFQGRGFYSYFVGEFTAAKDWAEQALNAATAAKDRYIRFLATDLMGHATVQMGRRSEGIRLIHVARELALRLGNQNAASGSGIAVLIYEAEAGWRPETISTELEAALGQLEVSDSYTRANLVLEVGRQWSLRGRWDEARELLNRESASIYAFGNRRQELLLQLRLAEIAYRQGDRFAAEHFVRAARRCLHDIADRAFETRVLGLELKIAQERAPRRVEKLLELSSEHSSRVNQQILSRQGLASDPGTSETEDPVHHLFRLFESMPALAASKAAALGYLGLWPQFMGLAPGASSFTVLEDNQSFVMAAPQGVFHHKKGLSSQNARLLQALSRGTHDKEKLAFEVWGYRYSPLRHDPLIYSAMTKLRKALEPCGDWIVTVENGWRLAPSVQWKLTTTETTPLTSAPAVLPGVRQRLNFRQLRAIQEPPQAGLWSIQAYKESFSVSTMTAFRDLDSLRELNFLTRSGKGRATRYHLPESARRSLK